MTRTIATLDIPSFYRATVGFDRVLHDLEKQFSVNSSQTYPPYNIIQLNDDEYVISIALAGFKEENLEIIKEKNTLRVRGAIHATTDNIVYLHKGIGSRSFSREFTLADYIEVESAEIEHGMLNINLKRVVPVEMQPKVISISSGKSLQNSPLQQIESAS